MFSSSCIYNDNMYTDMCYYINISFWAVLVSALEYVLIHLSTLSSHFPYIRNPNSFQFKPNGLNAEFL